MNLTVGTLVVWGNKLLNVIAVNGNVHTFNVLDTAFTPYKITNETLIMTQPEIAKAFAEQVFKTSPSSAATLKTATDAAGVGVNAIPPVNTVRPAVSGTVEVGETLTGTQGTWTGTPTPTYTRQWQVSDNGTSGWTGINGATASTFVLTSAQLGKFVRHVVTASNVAGVVSRDSLSTVVVAA